MKKKRLQKPLLLLALLPLLCGCGEKGESSPTRVNLSFGRLLSEGVPLFHPGKDGKDVHATSTTLEALIQKKSSFLLFAVPDEFCTCWNEWKNDVIAPYLKEHNLDAYFVLNDVLEKTTSLSFPTDGLKNQLGIYEDGQLKYRLSVETGDTLHDSKEAFANWMDERIVYPTATYVNKSQVDALYNGKEDFVLYYARSSCSDCASFETEFLQDYLKERENEKTLYVLDCDVEGLRFKDGVYNATQWAGIKQEYGLAESEDNPAGYSTGVVPTAFAIHPDGGKKKGVQLGANVFLNDEVALGEDGEYYVKSSYYEETRFDRDEELGYLLEKDINYPAFQGQKLGKTESYSYAWAKEKTLPYHKAVAKIFFDKYL